MWCGTGFIYQEKKKLNIVCDFTPWNKPSHLACAKNLESDRFVYLRCYQGLCGIVYCAVEVSDRAGTWDLSRERHQSLGVLSGIGKLCYILHHT